MPSDCGGGGFWVSHLETALDQGTDTRWVRTHGGYGHTVELLTATSRCGSRSTSERKPEIVMPTLKAGETEAQHQPMNHCRSFQRQMLATTVCPRFSPASSRSHMVFIEQNCTSDAVDGARFAAGPRHPPSPGFSSRLGSSLCCRTHKMALCDSSMGTATHVLGRNLGCRPYAGVGG